MENFIQAKLRIITLEEHLEKPQEMFSPLEVEARLYKFFETECCILNDILLTVYKIQICKYRAVDHHRKGAGYYGAFLGQTPSPYPLL